MNDHNNLAKAITLCLARDNYKVAFFCSRHFVVRDLLEHAKMHPDVMYTNLPSGEIGFENGSKIFITAPQGVTGWSVHKVFFDEIDSIPYELKQHLKTRERLE